MSATIDLCIPQPNALLGIDVSSHQHPNDEPIEWPTVAASGVVWTYVKEGEDRKIQNDSEGPAYGYYVNPWFERDVAGALDAGLRVGVYRFVRPTGTPPAESITRMETNVAHALGSLGLRKRMFSVCDFEENAGGDQLVWLSEWLAGVGDSPVLCKGRHDASWLYSGLTYLQRHGCLVPGATPTLAPYIHASYQKSLPPNPAHYTMRAWQFYDKGWVPGVPTPVDVNTFFGTLVDFDKLTVQAAA